MVKKIIPKSLESLIVGQELTYPKLQKHNQTLKKLLIEELFNRIAYLGMGNPIEFTKRVCTKEYIKKCYV